jgi:sarcosine oxidase
MSDGELAVIGLGSVGSMALWQASHLSRGVVGFEAASPAHPRSAVGGDSRLFRMTYRGEGNYYPILQAAQRLWRQLEQESGRDILTQCGGLSIGEVDGEYLPALMDSIKRTGAPHQVLDHAEMRRRYPQHHLAPDECGILDPEAGFLRPDRAVLAAVDAAVANGATMRTQTPVREIRETPDGVQVSTESGVWSFDRVVVASGSWSRQLLSPAWRETVRPYRIYLTWYPSRDPAQFAPEVFPIFIRINRRGSLYGTPSIDGATVKATLDGRGQPADDPETIDRALTGAEIAESQATVADFLPGLVPNIVRSDTYPDLYTADHAPIVGFSPGSNRVYLATGFSGAGFKMASAYGAIAARESLGEHPGVDGLDFVRPTRFAS